MLLKFALHFSNRLNIISLRSLADCPTNCHQFFATQLFLALAKLIEKVVQQRETELKLLRLTWRITDKLLRYESMKCDYGGIMV